MIISFAWTTPALLAGAKTMTRRNWSISHAEKFRIGDLVDAWDKSPRVGKSKARKVATIKITRDPYLRKTDLVRHEDYVREGFEWTVTHGPPPDMVRVLTIWRNWLEHPTWLWVVEFELVERVA